MPQDLALKDNKTETGRHLMDQGWLDNSGVAGQQTFACWRIFTIFDWPSWGICWHTLHQNGECQGH
jgi:hypothetical protein